VRGGFTTLPLSYSDKFWVNLDQEWLNKMDASIADFPQIAQALANRGLPTSSLYLDRNIDFTGKLGLLNGKLLLDYYPWQKYAFHLTGGFYFGRNYLVRATAKLPNETREVIEVLQGFKDVTGIDFDKMQVFEDYEIYPRNIDNLTVDLKINGVKPYLGLGFGRAVPKNRVGVAFELGAMFHGSPKLTSNNSAVERLIRDEAGDDLTKTLEKLSVYPVLSLRLTGRILP